MQEIWKDVCFEENGVEYNYCGLYQVSNIGNIKSLKFGKEKILKPRKTKYGYLEVGLWKDGTQKKFKIHRLVAFMFIKGYFDGAEVNHIDENKENNLANNLEFCTKKYNINFGTRNKRVRKAQNQKVIGYSLTETKVIIIQSICQAKKFGFNPGNICSCCNGKLKQHKGFIWKYIEEE